MEMSAPKSHITWRHAKLRADIFDPEALNLLAHVHVVFSPVEREGDGEGRVCGKLHGLEFEVRAKP